MDVASLIINDKYDGKINVNQADQHGWTALHYLVSMGKLDKVEYLLSLNAIIDYPTFNHETALHFAVFNNDYSMVRLLMLNGANPLIRDVKSKRPIDRIKSKEMYTYLLSPTLD